MELKLKTMEVKIKYEDLKALEGEWTKKGALQVHKLIKERLDVISETNPCHEAQRDFHEGYKEALKSIMKEVRDEFVK